MHRYYFVQFFKITVFITIYLTTCKKSSVIDIGSTGQFTGDEKNVVNDVIYLKKSSAEYNSRTDEKSVSTPWLHLKWNNQSYYSYGRHYNHHRHRHHFSRLKIHDAGKLLDNAAAGYVTTKTSKDIERHVSSPVIIEDQTLAVVGQNVELRCQPDVFWERNGVYLNPVPLSSELQVSKTGSLEITEVCLEHTGRYSCLDRQKEKVIKEHILQVLTLPVVSLVPETQTVAVGATATLRCNVASVPLPNAIRWEINGMPVPERYILLENNHTLTVQNARHITDTGMYSCVVHTAVATTYGVATVFVEDVDKEAPTHINGAFLVLHGKGYSIVEPAFCMNHKTIDADSKSFRHTPSGRVTTTLCGNMSVCNWSDSVTVDNRLLYVAQPELARIVTIDLVGSELPEVLSTGCLPKHLFYVNGLDQVWFLCFTSLSRTVSDDVLVVHDAARTGPHRISRASLDEVDDLFIPPVTQVQPVSFYGYSYSSRRQTLRKINLRTQSHVSEISLYRHNCTPERLTFVVLAGNVIVKCITDGPTKCLQIDYITDAVSHCSGFNSHTTYTSPDERLLTAVNTTHLSLYAVKDNGQLDHLFDRRIGLAIDDLVYIGQGQGYNIFAHSSGTQTLIHVSVVNHQISYIYGVDVFTSATGVTPATLVSDGVFGEYVASYSSKSMKIIDAVHHHLHCELTEFFAIQGIVWIQPSTG